MADITYGVNVEYLSSGNLGLPGGGSSGLDKMTAGFQKLQSAAASLNGILDGVLSGMTSLASSAAVGVGTAVVGGFGLAVKESIKFNSEMETAQTGIATMANAAEGLNGFLDPKEAFGNQYRLAGDIIKQMRKDAQELPGSFSDLQRIMSDLVGPAENAGLGQAATEKLAAKAMLAGSAAGIPLKQVGRELGEILAGSARITNPLFRALHMGSAKDVNKMSQKDRLHAADAAVTKLTAGGDSAKQNWSTVSSNFVDNLKIAVGVVGGPLVSRVKEVMKAFNDSDKGGFARIGERIGNGLVTAFDWGLAAFQKYLPVAEAFVGSMYRGIQKIYHQFQPLFSMIEAMVTNFFNNPNMFNKIEHIIGQLIAFRAGGAILEGGASMGGGLMKMGAASGMGAAEMGPIAVGLAAAVAAAAIAVYGFTSALTDSNSQLHDAAVKTSKATVAATSRLERELTENGSIFKDIAELWGVGVARVGEHIVGITADWAHSFNMLGEASRDLTAYWQRLAGVSKTSYGLEGDAKDEHERAIAARNGLFDDSAPMTFIKRLDASAEREKGPDVPKAPTHHTTIHKVEIKVNSNQDPSRIAKATVGLIREMARYPNSAAINPSGQFSKQ